MKLSKHVLTGLEDIDIGRFESALLHACIGIDATAKRMFPSERQVGRRYRACLRHYYWLLQQMCGGGINFGSTRFENVQLKGSTSPDFADIVYEVFRCTHAHGAEVPSEFSVVPTSGGFGSQWILRKGEVHMPDRVLFALFAVSVLAEANAGEASEGAAFLSFGNDRFWVREWWGKEQEFRVRVERDPIACGTLLGLGGMVAPPEK